MKATHNGHCQCCGRIQAVRPKTGKMAKHGYTVDYGWFNGTCAGSDNPPLEHNRELCDVRVKEMRRAAKALAKKTLDDVDTLEFVLSESGELVDYRPRGAGRTRLNKAEYVIKAVKRYSYVEDAEIRDRIIEREWGAKAENTVRGWHRTSEYLVKDAEALERLAGKVHGQRLMERK